MLFEAGYSIQEQFEGIDTIGPDSSAAKVYGYTALLGIGAGSYLAASFAVATALVTLEEVNNVVGFLSVGNRVEAFSY